MFEYNGKKLNQSVALLAEGVDRNTSSYQPFPFRALSPSSRRAWIEISEAHSIVIAR